MNDFISSWVPTAEILVCFWFN